MTANLITDVAGVRVGSAHDERIASGVTAVIFDEPAVASIAIHGGAPAVRDTALLEPEMTVEQVDAFVLSGGSAFGLDAAGGVMAYLAGIGRGFLSRGMRVPIVPGASLFDLVNGGDKAWGRKPPYWDMGFRAAEAAGAVFALGTAGAGYGANSFGLKGGLGSASAVSARGFRVGALVAANPGGRVTRGDTRHFLAAPFERDGEFGGHGFGEENPEDALPPAAEERPPGQHHPRRGRDRRQAFQGPGQAACGHGPGGLRARFPARPILRSTATSFSLRRPVGRRRRRSSGPRRNRHAGRRMRRPLDRARRLRGDPAAVSRRAAELAAAVRRLIRRRSFSNDRRRGGRGRLNCTFWW